MLIKANWINRGSRRSKTHLDNLVQKEVYKCASIAMGYRMFSPKERFLHALNVARHRHFTSNPSTLWGIIADTYFLDTGTSASALKRFHNSKGLLEPKKYGLYPDGEYDFDVLIGNLIDDHDWY